MNLSKPVVARALRVIDALLKGCAARGIEARAGTADGKQHGLVLVVDGEALHPWLQERVKRKPHEPTAQELAAQRRYSWTYIPRFDLVPTGELVLEIEVEGGFPYGGHGIRHRWADGTRRAIEAVLDEVVVGLLPLAVWQRARKFDHEAQRRRWREEERLRLERQVQREKERQELAELEATAERWHRAQRIRAFVDAFEARAAASGRLADPEGEAARWIASARRRADQLDPLSEHHDQAGL